MDTQYILRQDKYGDYYILPIDLEIEFLEWNESDIPNPKHKTFANYFIDLSKLIIYDYDTNR